MGNAGFIPSTVSGAFRFSGQSVAASVTRSMPRRTPGRGDLSREVGSSGLYIGIEDFR